MSRRVNSNITLRSSPRQVTPEKRGGRSQDNCSLNNLHHSFRTPSQEEMRAVFLMCRGNQWDSVFNSIRSNRLIATTNMTMDNNISTTVLHQAITSKGDIKKRARVIQEILSVTPQAATIKNGYGSLPLHVISQRNTKMDSKTKERLIRNLMDSYPESLTQQGGVGMRTPLHIIFTDYISPGLTSSMIHYGRQACFMRDKKGFLPVHVACSRHCSPEKLEMLLQVNPASLFAKTGDGRSLLGLAQSTATKSHPNYALINEIERRLQIASLTVMNQFTVQDQTSDHLQQGTIDWESTMGSTVTTNVAPVQPKRRSKRKRKASVRGEERIRQLIKKEDVAVEQVPALVELGNISMELLGAPIKMEDIPMGQQEENPPIKQEDREPANLLLHFSRHMKNVASV